MASKTIEETYQKKTPKEHILLRPDTYIGSIERDLQTMYVWNKEKSKIQSRTITFVPGLYKIFDEILVNAADNKQRDKKMSRIKVNITNKTVSIYNNGKGIPVKMHKKEKIYVPELIFGNLLTSSNYDDKENKLTGGRNGYGAKLCNIFSRKFIVETCCKNYYYKQIFRNNMSETGEPSIEHSDCEDFTRITFEPDFSKFGMTEFDEDIISLFTKRVYDMCGTVKKCKISLNDEELLIKSFQEYVQLYFEGEPSIVHKVINDRWELACTASEDQFTQVSFVNSICTSKGGTHVSHVVERLMQPLSDAVKKQDKNLSIKPFNIKNSLFIAVNCLIENPAFDSQTKENLTLKSSSFGSKCQPIEDFVKGIIKKTDIIEKIVAFSKAKQSVLLKKTDGTKTSKITGIPKLEDANMAGTKNSSRCTLILTEGNSAKTLAVAGLSVVGRDTYGIFPLRGKLLNVRDATHKQIMENQEINAVKKILGLQHGKCYETTENLRYGHIMIMTDQDHDGSHIKGLLINFFEYFFPSLLLIRGFLTVFITPIVRATKSNHKEDFFTIPEYEIFKEREGVENLKHWKIKYYKGLGTSTAQDAKNYFSKLDFHVKTFLQLSIGDKGQIDLAFNKKKADMRKQWLADYVTGDFLDQRAPTLAISDFVSKELILFSMADNIRSIPSMVDGFKPGQRKVLFSCFKRKLHGEIKVAQLAGYIAEHSAYHHGEISLNSTIVNMAHDFVGSNNINLLQPIGQFGSRLLGGKDAASTRYIYTSLCKITRLIFPEVDDPVLDYLHEENLSIEPAFYVPIIPMVLVNGAEGIGTGWSTSIPSYNPIEIVENIKRLLRKKEMVEMAPFYKHWNGKMIKHGEGKFVSCGKAKVVSNGKEISITELPVGTWTSTFKEYLDDCIIKNQISKYWDRGTHRTVDLLLRPNGSFKIKLASSISLGNMVAFNSEGKITKYNSPLTIIKEYFPIRYRYYEKRKIHRLSALENELLKLNNKARFILLIVNGDLIILKRKEADIIRDLDELKFSRINDSFDYLVDMPISVLTIEKIEKLNNECSKLKKEYDELFGTSVEDLWIKDLDNFVREYKKVVEEEANSIAKDTKDKNKKSSSSINSATGKEIDVYSLYKNNSKSSSDISLKVPKSSITEKSSSTAVKVPKKPSVKKVTVKASSVAVTKEKKNSLRKTNKSKSINKSSSSETISSDIEEDFVVSSEDEGPWSKYKK